MHDGVLCLSSITAHYPNDFGGYGKDRAIQDRTRLIWANNIFAFDNSVRQVKWKGKVHKP